MSLLESFDLLLPPLCDLCGARRERGTWTCGKHRSWVDRDGSDRCHTCARTLCEVTGSLGASCDRCRREPPEPLARTVCIGDYRDDDLRALCLAFKHGGAAHLARPFAGLLAPRLRATASPGVRPVLVPVPLHGLRRLERGYDQAALLARALAAELDWPVVHALARTRPTPPQGSPLAAERSRNVRGAFRVRRRCVREVAGHAWLVDDVATSLATAREAAAVLRRASRAQVRLAVVARA